jgi:hypothetical protein
MARCPNCSCTLHWDAQLCPKCQANLGSAANWHAVPETGEERASIERKLGRQLSAQDDPWLDADHSETAYPFLAGFGRALAVQFLILAAIGLLFAIGAPFGISFLIGMAFIVLMQELGADNPATVILGGMLVVAVVNGLLAKLASRASPASKSS